MAFDYINEAFKRLDLLDEQMFDTSLKGMNELADFLDNDNTDDIIRVIDPEATQEEELQDSYIGKVILNCNICHSYMFEDKEEIKINEDGTVNDETHCPYCGEAEGFVIVGEIAPFVTDVIPDEEESDETSDEEEAEETSEEEVVEEAPDEDDSTEEPQEEMEEGLLDTLASFSPAANLASKLMDSVEDSDDKDVLEEDFKEVTITTDDQHMEMTSDDNGKVTVTTEPIVEADVEAEPEVIAPVSDDTAEDILDNNAEVIDAEPVENVPTEETLEEPVEELPEEEVTFDFDEIDEEGLNELGEAYLRNVYENVTSFQTTSAAANEQTLIVEGIINFTSGAKKKTGFVFEAKDVNSRGKVRFVGSNNHLCESSDAFSLVGCVDNKKLFVESLKYNYKVNEEPVRGVVRRK